MTGSAGPAGILDSPIPPAEAKRLLVEKERRKDAKGSLSLPYYNETMSFTKEEKKV